MTNRTNGKPHPLALATAAVRQTLETLLSHWLTALFSLVAAFAIWFVIQDVENPRVEGSVPLESEPAAVETVAKNAGDYLVRDLVPVRVQVDARKGELLDLRPSDFEAYVDVQGVQPGSGAVELTVRATSKRPGVRVIGVTPSTMRVTVVQAATKEVPVTLRRVGELPTGYRESTSSDPTIEPAFVTVRGLPELVQTVTSAEVVVNLAGARGDTLSTEGDLIARTDGGGEVTVKFSQSRARVTLKVEQFFVQRTVAVTPIVSGVVQAGYRITNVSVDPPTVIVNGPKAVIDSIPLGVTTERVDVTGARADVVLTRNIDQPANTLLDRKTVTVRIEIKPIECSTGVGVPCGTATFTVAPDFGLPPVGLYVEPGLTTVEVRVSGPLTTLAALRLIDFRASVSLAGGQVGTASYPVVVAPIAGVKIEAVDPIVLTLRSVTGP